MRNTGENEGVAKALLAQLNKLVRSRQIRSIKIGRQIRVPRDAVAEYLRGQ